MAVVRRDDYALHKGKQCWLKFDDGATNRLFFYEH
jgi:hypothetical protein